MVRKIGRIGGNRGVRLFTRENVTTIRLDPETRFLVDLAARIESRTFNSFIEWAAKVALAQVKVPGAEGTTFSDLAGQVWSPDEMTRFIAMMFKYPRLLDVKGQVLRKLIQDNGYLWRGDYDSGEYKWSTHRIEVLDIDRLRDNWDKFKAVAEGKADSSTLPKWDRTKKKEK